MAGISAKAVYKPENRRKFNDGTELTNSLDLNWYETDFRSYDPQLGRFHQIDELTEFDLTWSPYAYAHNNPILLNDPLGLTADTTNGNNGNSDFLVDDDGNPKVFDLKGVTVTAKKASTVGQPGLIESIIPVWGSGRAAIDDFQNGRWGWGIFNSAMTVLDVATFGAAGFVIKAPVKALAKEGVYLITTRSGRYIGQTKNFIVRITRHFGKGGKLSGQQLKKALLHEMPGSTKLEREVYEQYLIDKHGLSELQNIVNPMGGRRNVYDGMVDDVIKKYNLPR